MAAAHDEKHCQQLSSDVDDWGLSQTHSRVPIASHCRFTGSLAASSAAGAFQWHCFLARAYRATEVEAHAHTALQLGRTDVSVGVHLPNHAFDSLRLSATHTRIHIRMIIPGRRYDVSSQMLSFNAATGILTHLHAGCAADHGQRL